MVTGLYVWFFCVFCRSVEGREGRNDQRPLRSRSTHTSLPSEMLLTVPGLPFWLPGMKPPPWSIAGGTPMSAGPAHVQLVRAISSYALIVM